MKNLKISAELLSEVLGYKIDERDIFLKNNYGYFAYCRSDNEWINCSLNIYELAYRCKEWALSKGYILSSNNYYNGGCCQIIQRNGEECIECGESSTFKYIHSFTEIEAVIKACEWLMEEIK